jgi:UDP-glucose:(heptosyl)LPS alpha-1,3-glucosyltransferase
MKIALIRRQFSATGGAELYLQRLQATLAQAGHEAHLFAEAWEFPAPCGSRREEAPISNTSKSEPPCVGCYEIQGEGERSPAVFHAVPVSGSRAARPLRFAEMVRQMLASERFDCVFSLERTLQQDVYRAGDGVHRVWLERRREFAPWWRKPFIGLGGFHRNMLQLEARTFDPANTRRIIVNSEMVRREILAHFNFPADQIHLVRNGIDVAWFQSGQRAETRARFGIKDDEFLLLFAGSGWERKGLAFVLQALPRLNAANRCCRLLIAGKGRRPSAAPPNAIFAGPMRDVENAYAAADLLVFPPIYEPSSNVVIEALAAGLPVITSAYNGAAEVLEEGVTGTVLKNPADIDGMVRAVDFWAEKKARVTADAAALSLERNVKETLAVLELAANERKA